MRITEEAQTVSVNQAAQRLGISRAFAYQLIARSEFPVPVQRLGKRLLVWRDPLTRYIEAACAQSPNGVPSHQDEQAARVAA